MTIECGQVCTNVQSKENNGDNDDTLFYSLGISFIHGHEATTGRLKCDAKPFVTLSHFIFTRIIKVNWNPFVHERSEATLKATFQRHTSNRKKQNAKSDQ